MKTLPLTSAWDLQLDPAGNLNLAASDASLAQDVASALRSFLGENWYDTTLGLPYFQSIFGRRPPTSLVVAKIKRQALRVNGVGTVRVVGLQLLNRALTGTVVVTPANSSTPLAVNF